MVGLSPPLGGLVWAARYITVEERATITDWNRGRKMCLFGEHVYKVLAGGYMVKGYR